MTVGRRARQFGQCEAGASAVEFAIVVVPLLLLVFGSLEFGRFMWTRAAVHEAAIAGARCMGTKQAACVSGGVYSSSQTTTFVRNKGAGWSIAIPVAAVSLDNNATCSTVTGFSRVTIALTFNTAVPLLLPRFSGGVPIQAVACFPNQA